MAYDLADESADGGNLITDLDRISHIALRLIALTLRTDEQE